MWDPVAREVMHAKAGGQTGSAAHGACAGELRSFSEQQVMDCSWRDGNEACDGGDSDTAIDYVVQARPCCHHPAHTPHVGTQSANRSTPS